MTETERECTPAGGATEASPEVGPHASPRPGPCATRRRGETLEQAIYAAVVHELSNVGYAGLTMEGVAAAAHTGKASLYRRWTSKDDLVVDALLQVMPDLDEGPDSGDIRADLLSLVGRLAGTVNGPAGCALQLLLGKVERDHEFVRSLHDRVIDPRRRKMLSVLRRAADRRDPPVSLGYSVAGCSSLEYKARFRPNEVLGGGGAWLPLLE